jgi:hypothetical protein
VSSILCCVIYKVEIPFADIDRSVSCGRLATISIDNRGYCSEHAQRYFQEEVNARKRPRNDKKVLAVSTT